MIKYVVGDATEPIQRKGIRIIAHIINDAGKWGAGFSGALSRKWKDPEEYYRNQYRWVRNYIKLGDIQWKFINENLAVCGLIAQHDVRSRHNRIPIRYDALDTALERLAEGCRRLEGRCLNSDKVLVTLHMPRIGTGLAGGTWDRIEPLIEERLWDLQVYIYDLKI